MTSQSLHPEIRLKVRTLGVRICLLEQRIEQYRQIGFTTMLKAAQPALETYRKQRRELRGY